jgi:hypothetical protein
MKGLRLAFPLAAAVGLAACGGAPTSPQPQGTPPVATAAAAHLYAGNWRIEFRVDECGARNCPSIRGNVLGVIVRLAATPQNGLEGVFSASTQTTTDVRGHVDEAGRMDVRGKTEGPFPGTPGSFDVELAALDASISEQGLSGTIAYSIRGEGFSSQVGGPITRAERLGALPGESFTGTWSGQAAVRSCTSAASPYCSPEDRHYMTDVRLELVDHGARVSGELRIGSRAIPLEGPTAGGSATLSGSFAPPSPGTMGTTVTSLSITRDKVGRLEGTLKYTTHVAGALHTTYDDVQLWSVIVR